MGSLQWSKVGSLLLIGTCIVFGQNCAKDVDFSMGQKKSTSSAAFETDDYKDVILIDDEISPDDLDDSVDVTDLPEGDDAKKSCSDSSKEKMVRNCVAAVRALKKSETLSLIPGARQVSDNRGLMSLGSYEELSIYNSRGHINIDYADIAPEIIDIRGSLNISAGAVGLISNVRGVVCIGVEEGIEKVENIRGYVVVVGTGEQKALVQVADNLRGRVLLYNAEVGAISNIRGQIAQGR